MLIPVILSGGSGTRLWPLSRELYPKQLLPLVGKGTMLQETLARLAGVADLPNARSQRLLERLGFRLVAETDGPRYRLRHYAFDRRTPPERC